MSARERYGSLQSLAYPQFGQTILQCASLIRSPQRSQVWTHSRAPGRRVPGDGRGRWSMPLVHYSA